MLMKRPNVLDWIALILIIVGGLNWGLFGIFHLDLVAMLFGDFSTLARVVYVLVGLAALYAIVRAFLCCKKCDSSGSTPQQ